ncbi:hypothetical protein [Saccharopolyspora dendranthemae]|nr:hypothetical protein [Saccharopolyspora dendranthemae]
MTTSALAGLIVGGFLVVQQQAAQQPAIEQVSQLTPAAGGSALPE